MSMTASVEHLVAQQMACASSSWSIGGFGAIAEFHHVAGIHEVRSPTSVVTPLGAISLIPHTELRAIAYEIPAQRADYWHHGIVFCLPEGAARIAAPGRVAALGPDTGALVPEDASCSLYDLGVGASTFRFCVRTRDPGLCAALDAAVGRPFPDAAATLVPRLIASSPARVALCAIGRIEVYQPIALPEGRTPDGPHTHLIPQLLRSTHTHSRNVPVPVGWLPVATAYPAHPLADAAGQRKPFNRDEHFGFQALLERFGAHESLRAKGAVVDAVRSGLTPEPGRLPGGRHARLAARVGLRQLLHTASALPMLEPWIDRLDQRPTL